MGTGRGRAGKVSALGRELHKRGPFSSPAQEAFLNLVRTYAVLTGPFDRLFKSRGLTSTRYNVLRILRGAGRGGRTCGEIREHMVWAVPDVTRIVDGLVRAGLAVRGRETLDARVVRIRITARGLGLLRRLDPAVEALHLEQLGSMGEGALEELNDLLVRARRATGGIAGAGDHAEESG